MYFKFLWLIKIYRYYKGRLWCITFHSPVVRCMGGYGGTDHFGRRRKYSLWTGSWVLKAQRRTKTTGRKEETGKTREW